MIPSGTDIRRMLAKARELKEAGPTLAESKELPDGLDDDPSHFEVRMRFLEGVEYALAWVLGERKEPPIA